MPDPSEPARTDKDEFYRILGSAFTRWQDVETSLYAISFILLRTDHQAASIAFFHIQSAVGKVSFVDKLCKLRLRQSLYQTKWVPLRKRLTLLVDARNAMAHFEIRNVTPPYPEHMIDLPKVAMLPNYYDTERSLRFLDAKILKDADAEFLEISVDLICFACECAPDWQQRLASLPPGLLQNLPTRPRTETPPKPPLPPGPAQGQS